MSSKWDDAELRQAMDAARPAFNIIWRGLVEAVKASLPKPGPGQFHMLDSMLRNPNVSGWMKRTGFREFEVSFRNGEQRRYRLVGRIALPSHGRTLFVCEPAV